MHLCKSIIIAIFGIALVSCATTETTRAPATSLVADFQDADKLMTSDDFDSIAIADLRSRLHARLRLEGDEAFASALDTISEMKRVSVVNVMGFMDPSDYDQFPKTQHLLSAAPKI
jgi:hypothetical protein